MLSLIRFDRQAFIDYFSVHGHSRPRRAPSLDRVSRVQLNCLLSSFPAIPTLSSSQPWPPSRGLHKQGRRNTTLPRRRMFQPRVDQIISPTHQYSAIRYVWHFFSAEINMLWWICTVQARGGPEYVERRDSSLTLSFWKSTDGGITNSSSSESETCTKSAQH